jgi:16S rRNA (guanine527-N7)-methyltransferase
VVAVNSLPCLPSSSRKLLDEGLVALGLASGLAEPLQHYVRLLLLWNGTFNLTAIRDADAIMTKHVLDCLAMVTFVQQQSLVDVGSGAGLPGLVLALARPNLQVVLVETAGKKARFLREALRALELGERVQVQAVRAEALVLGEGSALLTARAFGTIEEILRVAGHLLAPEGRLLAMKGRREELLAEPMLPGWALLECHRLQVPGLAAERHLAVVGRCV